MEQNSLASWKTILTSLLAGYILIMLPLPDWITRFRPDWITLIVLYWNIHTPGKISIGSAFLCGILLDLAYGTLLGQHALGLTIISFIAVKLHHRVRAYPIAQQSIFILLLLLLKQLLLLWVYGLTGHAPSYTFVYFSASLIGILLWPLITTLIEQAQRAPRRH